MKSVLLPVSLAFCVAASAALWLWPEDSRAGELTAPAASEKPAPAKSDEAPTLQARWTAPATVRNPSAEELRRMIRLPTGEYTRSLNGAIDATPLPWPTDRPYSPILGVERAPDGKEWWVHADGSKSTTEMVFRSDLGRHDAVSEVANPTAALPMLPEDIERANAGGQPGDAGKGVGKKDTKATPSNRDESAPKR